MVDVICFFCKKENLDNPSKALEAPLYRILPKGNHIVRHLAPNSSLLEAIDYILEGTQNLVIPIQKYTSTNTRTKLTKSSSLSCKHHDGVEYCGLTQEDIVRFLLNLLVSSPL